MWMDLRVTILSEVNHTEKDKYHMILLICGILKKKKKKMTQVIFFLFFYKNRNRPTENKFMVAKGEGGLWEI